MADLLTLAQIERLEHDLKPVALAFPLHEPVRRLLATARAYWVTRDALEANRLAQQEPA